ncbi:MAG: glycogen synthase GlgA [Clostridia bacterium]|nr:glycogen synthase GlgA [Clostridia bacterium]
MINNILMVSSEAVPFAKSGGLADVAGTLPKAIVDNGYDIRVVLPLYKTIKDKYRKDMKKLCSFNVRLGWRNQTANIYEYRLRTDMGNTLIYYLIQNDYYFERDSLYGFGDDGERFMFFSKAVLEMLPQVGFKPEMIHCNDWQTGTIPCMLKEVYAKRNTFYSEMKTLYTIHNLKFQGICGFEFLEMMELDSSYYTSEKLEFWGGVSMMKAGILYCDKLNTVSETYSREIQLPSYGCNLDGLLRSVNDKLYGVLNGIDNDFYNPTTDRLLFKNYNNSTINNKLANKMKLQEEMGLEVNIDVPLIAMVSRITDQKGFDMVAEKMDELIGLNAQFIIQGTGEKELEDMFKRMEAKAPGRVKANMVFSEEMANKIYGAADMILIPSRFEPCGLTQLISFRYGTVPVVRHTGGLADTVIPYSMATGEGTGFSFRNCDAKEMMIAIKEAIRIYENKAEWSKLVKNVMELDYSWNTSAMKYVRLYEGATGLTDNDSKSKKKSNKIIRVA